ncbi:MAG: hypothetical protein K2P57_03180 [Burkholderiales bacterium]|nr:hypothetical protein [Burkholderiales bacterium]
MKLRYLVLALSLVSASAMAAQSVELQEGVKATAMSNADLAKTEGKSFDFCADGSCFADMSFNTGIHTAYNRTGFAAAGLAVGFRR